MIAENETDSPKRQTKESAGYDFYMPYDLDMEPGIWYTIDTQVSFTGKEKPYFDCTLSEEGEYKNARVFPRFWYMQLMPRSSLGYKYGFRLANTVGVIDKDYVDHHISAKVMVEQSLSLKKGERFMQGVFIPVAFDLFEDIPTATRDGGHGSTGA